MELLDVSRCKCTMSRQESNRRLDGRSRSSSTGGWLIMMALLSSCTPCKHRSASRLCTRCWMLIIIAVKLIVFYSRWFDQTHLRSTQSSVYYALATASQMDEYCDCTGGNTARWCCRCRRDHIARRDSTQQNCFVELNRVGRCDHS